MATNSETFYRLKDAFNGGFGTIETTAVNTAMKLRLRRQLGQFMKSTDTLAPEYKSRIEAYWKPYHRVNTRYHAWYSSRNGICDPRYIPDDLYYTVIDQHFNNRKYGWGVNDKNYYSLLFPDVKQPTTVIRKINNIYYNADYRIISENEAIRLCKQQEALIIKPANETGGSRGIQFWTVGEGIKGKIQKHSSLIVQTLIKQHKALSEIHSNSVNTLRIMTLIINDQVYHISTVLRMGVGGSRVDNASAGGITCGVKNDGQLKDVAYNAHGDIFTEHPQGYHFNKCKVPNYNKAVDVVKCCHEKLGHFRLVSWDVAIDDEEEPVLIEANLRNGECDFHQFNNGPLFGDLTDQVLQEVFMKRI